MADIQQKQTVNQPKLPKVGVFGYGSLVNLGSLAVTLGYQPATVTYVMLRGWVRDWTVRCTNNSSRGRFEIADEQRFPDHVLALNIQKSAAGKAVNGIVFEVSDTDIVALDMRETHYDRIDVTNEISGEHDFDIIYTYTGRTAELVGEAEAAIIPASYAAVVEEGFQLLGEDAHAFYLSSTLPSTYQTVATNYIQSPGVINA